MLRSFALEGNSLPASVRARRGARAGARPLSRLVQTDVRNPLTDEILFGRLEHGGTVHVGFDGEKLTFAYDPAPPPGEVAPPEPATAS